MLIKNTLFVFSLFVSTSLFALMPHDSNRIIVKFKSSQNVNSIKNVQHYKNLFQNVYVLYSLDIEALHTQLDSNQNVEYVERDYLGKRDKLAKVVKNLPMLQSNKKNSYFNDPKIDRLWAFRDPIDKGVSINSAYQFSSSATREEVIVAVVDTGVDFNHEDLVSNMWVNKNEIPNNGLDDDNNGYIDDIHGINTLERDQDQNPTVDIMDKNGHGTHVAGTIAATQNNNIGIAGIAKNAKIMGIRTVPGYGDEKDVDIIEAFIYAAENGAKIINCSFGKSHNEGGNAVKDAITYIGEKYGVLVVVAAGNSRDNIEDDLIYPASFDNNNLFVITSTSGSGRLSYFSNYGSNSVDLAAPGSNIYSLAPSNSYTSMSGTSMASPVSAGIAAELLSQHPSLSAIEVKEILMQTITPSKYVKNKAQAEGRIDLLRALQSL